MEDDVGLEGECDVLEDNNNDNLSNNRIIPFWKLLYLYVLNHRYNHILFFVLYVHYILCTLLLKTNKIILVNLYNLQK